MHIVLYLVVFYLKVNWRNVYIESFTLQQCGKANALLKVVQTPHSHHHKQLSDKRISRISKIYNSSSWTVVNKYWKLKF